MTGFIVRMVAMAAALERYCQQLKPPATRFRSNRCSLTGFDCTPRAHLRFRQTSWNIIGSSVPRCTPPHIPAGRLFAAAAAPHDAVDDDVDDVLETKSVHRLSSSLKQRVRVVAARPYAVCASNLNLSRRHTADKSAK